MAVRDSTRATVARHPRQDCDFGFGTALMHELRMDGILCPERHAKQPTPQPEVSDQRHLSIPRDEQNVALAGSSPIPSYPVKSA